MAIPQIPILQKSKEQIADEMGRQAPAQQQNFDLSQGQDRSAQFGYLEASQDFTAELMSIRALLEGKIMQVDSKNRVCYAYPRAPDGTDIIKPFCNPLGQAKIFGWVATVLQKGTPLSNFSIDTSLDRNHVTSRVFTRQLYIKADEWDIDPDELDGMVELIMDRIETARRRSVDNKERGLVQETVAIIQNLQGNANKDKNGLIPVQKGRL